MYNDTKTIYKKVLTLGTAKDTGGKVTIELEINQEAADREKMTTDHRTITGYKTLSMCGDIWKKSGTDIVSGGQNYDELSKLDIYKELYVSTEDLQKIIDVWKRWHLNDMKAGTEKQNVFLTEWEKSNKYEYKAACEALKQANLYEDNGYKYGHSWLIEELPESVITKIKIIFNKYDKKEVKKAFTGEVIFEGFKIKSSYQGNKNWNDDNKSMDNWNNHFIKVTNQETKQKITFEYWNSIADGEIKSDQEILQAFECLVTDAIAAENSFEDFCSEFGYDQDSRKAEKIYNACKKQLTKLQKVYDGDIYELAEKF